MRVTRLIREAHDLIVNCNELQCVLWCVLQCVLEYVLQCERTDSYARYDLLVSCTELQCVLWCVSLYKFVYIY